MVREGGIWGKGELDGREGEEWGAIGARKVGCGKGVMRVRENEAVWGKVLYGVRRVGYGGKEGGVWG